MTADHHLPLSTFYQGWEAAQQRLITTITHLKEEHLALRGSHATWSIDQITSHIVAARVYWFYTRMGEGSNDLAPLEHWDRREERPHSSGELADGLERTGRLIADTLARWTPADLDQRFPSRTTSGDSAGPSRQWIIWHVIEHDLVHAGEISLLLGLHGLTTHISN